MRSYSELFGQFSNRARGETRFIAACDVVALEIGSNLKITRYSGARSICGPHAMVAPIIEDRAVISALRLVEVTIAHEAPEQPALVKIALP